MRVIYSFAIYLYSLAINIASLFNAKAKSLLKGRRNLFSDLEKEVFPNNIIWIHTASVGEFEQAIPLIESIKKNKPDKKILITFFSPSGYEHRKDYELADYVYYLPLDLTKNARRFLDIVKPEMVFFVKYEFWFNFINEINFRDIPLYLISGIFRQNQHFFKWYGKWFVKHISMFNHLFVQDRMSAELLESINVTNYSITGDTRFDRVNAITVKPRKFDCIDEFRRDSKILLCGSTWSPDEDILLDYINEHQNELKLIIAPHEVNEAHLLEIERKFSEYNPIKLSSLEKGQKSKESRVLIIDSVGKLVYLYQYADIAYIGGGFGVGIHNILEAACYAKPVIFGPKYSKFKEARDLIELGGAFSISSSKEFAVELNKMLYDKDALSNNSNICAKYVKQNIGATDLIFNATFN